MLQSLTGFYHLSHEPLSDGCSFKAAVTDGYAIDGAILYSLENGIAMDSSWRHLNQNKCPVTLVTTVNSHHRMVPSES